jgi:hypothetical protein
LYTADKTSLFWRYLSQKTVVTPQETAQSGFKDSKERPNVLACSNAVGSHKARLLVVGKSRDRSALPLIYSYNK